VLGHAQDVTERLHLEQKLRESREQFRDLVEGSIQGVMMHRHDQALFVNQAYAMIHGYDTPDDILRLDTIWSLVAPGEQPRMRQYDAECLPGKTAPTHFEYQGVRKDGSVIWLDNKVCVICWDGVPAILHTVYDITTRKQAEMALQASAAQLRLVMDHVPVIIAYVDRELRYRFANNMFETWYGLSPEDVHGKRVIDVIGDAAFQAIKGSLHEVLAGHTVSLETLMPYQYGGPRYVKATYVPHVAHAGEVLGYFALVEDITERKQVEAQLAETLEQVAKNHDDLVALLNHLRVGTILLDEDGRVTFLSRTCQRLLGISTSAAMHQEWEHIFPCTLREKAQLKEICGRPLSARSRVSMSLKLPGGTQYWVDVDVQDDPREPRRKIFLLYDMSEVRDLRRLLDERGQFAQMVGHSAAMQRVFHLIRQAAQVETTVLIEGETGTGKELVARAIHNISSRQSKPFIAINCAGLSESMLGSQLFGHKRGAFTGAIADHLGLFEAANGGSLFLDEIGDMPLSIQTTLLRVLQEREITRLGDTTPRPIDVRILVATQHDLDNEVRQGRFRADLLYRIRVMRLRLPALRERREDIPLLVNAFFADKQTVLDKPRRAVSQEAMQRLLTYAWPGNVRELESAIEFAILHCKGAVIQPGDLPPEILQDSVPDAFADTSPDDERQRVLNALRRAGGNKARAARLLGIGRTTLYRTLARLNIPPDELPSRRG
jgi:PAS domain S-box-containing protein